MASDCRLTTIDNPYDPFDQFPQWFLFDVENGYDTCSRLDRVSHYTDDMSEKEVDEEHERAVDAMIRYDFLNIYKKVYRKDKKSKERVHS